MGPIDQRFRIQKPLGKGGIGEAFLAVDLSRDECLVVLKKVPKTSVSKKIESLRKEFATLSRLAHPNIAQVMEFGEDQDSYFFVEEYVDGTDIFEVTHQANYNQILSSLAQLLRALNYIHHQGLIHGDLKAENILVVRNASLFQEDSVKLIDFGLAKSLAEIQPTERPSGTLHFMAPEILQGLPYDHRADLFALGVCLYRMLTGRYPFQGVEEKGRLDLLIRAQIERIPAEPQHFRADLSKGLNNLTMRLLQKSPYDRFQSAAEVLRALNEGEGERFPLWTEAEFQISLTQGSFVGRERELKILWDRYREGVRQFLITGEEGIGKSRLAKEFRMQLQLVGEEDADVLLLCKEGLGEVDPVVIRDLPHPPSPYKGEEPSIILLPPWSRSETEFFVKDRLRLETIPDEWKPILEKMTQGIPQKVIDLLDHWVSEGVITIENDHGKFIQSPPKGPLDFDSILQKKLSNLEKNKRGLLELAAFARSPLSKELLQRISGLSAGQIDPLLESLEKENWLERILYNGRYHYQVDGGKVTRLVGPSLKSKSIDSLLNLVEETYRAGNHLRAKRYLEDLFSTSKFPSPQRGEGARRAGEGEKLHAPPHPGPLPKGEREVMK